MDALRRKNAVYEKDLPGIDKAVLLALDHHADNAGYCYPSYARLSKLSGFSRDAVIKAVSRLEQAGHIAVARNSKNSRKSNRYILSYGSSQPLALVAESDTNQSLEPRPKARRFAANVPLERRCPQCGAESADLKRGHLCWSCLKLQQVGL